VHEVPQPWEVSVGKYGEDYALQCRSRKEPEREAQEECAAIGHEYGEGTRCLFCGHARAEDPTPEKPL
jgi:hypothetical protein